MRILLYVMSFFIFSAENVPMAKRPFKFENYSRHEKYPNLQTRCHIVEKKNGFVDYIKDKYSGFQESKLSRLNGETGLDKLKKQIKLTIVEDRRGQNEEILLPTLLKLLNAIPDTIIIRGGIIYTEADSIVSAIDITETISEQPTDKSINLSKNMFSRLPYNHRVSEVLKYGDVEFVIMDSSDLYAFYKCEHPPCVKKYLLRCTLRLHTKEKMNNFVEYLTPILDENLQQELKTNSNVQFELHFSYICKFFSPLQVFLNNNILQYKILNFTVSGYQLTKSTLSTECIGLTYCLQHQTINNYDPSLKEYFLYEFDVQK
ncbi:uncharacterized protein LOC142333189 isoform X2 [Lycorma delicatula]|uniref:uncharacterized protein LOC142333189 isoform X2 n=1 Tax=Lycorma delicatula TaxID=130591 RepID=UPI003F5186D4